MEDSDCVGAASDAGCDCIGQAAGQCLNLDACFEADHSLEVPNDGGERVRACRGTEAVIGVVRVGNPVAQGFVDRVLERARTGLDRNDLRAEQAHACDVQCLTFGVDSTHVDDALETEQCTGGGRCHTVLACSGLGDDAGLAHTLCQQNLTENVVDLVRTGVVQIFTLENDARTTGELAHSRCLENRRRASRVIALQAIEFVQERVVRASLFVLRGDLFDDRHESFRHMPAAVDAEMAAGIGSWERSVSPALAGGRLPPLNAAPDTAPEPGS